MGIEFESIVKPKTDQERVLERMQKIRALAEGGGTPGEVAAATAMLAKLMQQHGISQAEIQINSDGELTGYGHAELTDKRNVPWRESLAVGLARGYMCRIVVLERSPRAAKWDIIGHRDNIAEVQRLYPFLVDLFFTMVKLHYQIEKVTALREHRTPPTEGLFKRSFLMGCAQGVATALAEQMRMQGVNHEATLIVINDKVEETMHKLYPNLSRGVSRKVKLDNAAWSKGYAEGKQAQFREGLQ